MKNKDILAAIALAILAVCATFTLTACREAAYFVPEKQPYDADLPDTYRQITLDSSSSADALAAMAIYKPEVELISQTPSVIASIGQKKKGREIWFNLVAFDEDKLTATRKYFFVIDEKPKDLFNWLKQKNSFIFETRMLLDEKTLSEPYASQNARRIAIIEKIREQLQNIE